MFGTLFSDSMANMTPEEIDNFNTIIDHINGDLKTIVDYTMENNVTAGSFDGTNTKTEPIDYAL